MKKVAQLTNSDGFHKVVSFAIISCSFVLGLETVLDEHKYSSILNMVDIGITLFFISEIFLRLLAEKTPLHYFILFTKRKSASKNQLPWMFSENGFWNWFDFLITIGSAVALVEHLFVHPEYLFITRMFRIFRIFRLLEISQKMREVEKKIANIIPTVFSFGLLISVLIYIYAILGYYLFQGQDMGHADFSTLSQSIVTMFRVMTLDGWGDIMKAAETSALHLDHWVFVLFFLSFIGLTAIVTLNIFIAVLASNVEVKMSDSENSEEIDINVDSVNVELKDELTDLKSEISLLRQEILNLKK